MANRAAIECTDTLCQEIKKNDLPFGGIPFVAVGDFRQVSPVVKGIGCAPALDASLKSSHLWPKFRTFTLDEPVRSATDPDFTAAVDDVGEDWRNSHVQLDIIQRLYNIEEVIDFLYPVHVLRDPIASLHRAFLSPLNLYVEEFNRTILDMLPGDDGNLYKSYSLCTRNQTDFLSQLSTTVLIA